MTSYKRRTSIHPCNEMSGIAHYYHAGRTEMSWTLWLVAYMHVTVVKKTTGGCFNTGPLYYRYVILRQPPISHAAPQQAAKVLDVPVEPQLLYSTLLFISNVTRFTGNAYRRSVFLQNQLPFT